MKCDRLSNSQPLFNDVSEDMARRFASVHSSDINLTDVKDKETPRDFYMQNSDLSPAPVVSFSADLVPQTLLDHLMRSKKDGALGVKFVRNNSPMDSITNMEGLLHTYITALVIVNIHGDHKFDRGHRMVRPEPKNGFQQARSVILSAAVQPDFEDKQVMFEAARLEEKAFEGYELPHDFTLMDTSTKQSNDMRWGYDRDLKAHIIARLTSTGRLPSIRDVHSSWTVAEATEELSRLISMDCKENRDSILDSMYLRRGNDVLSMDLLFRSALHQCRNEILALEKLCSQGYILTIDPPSIFARQIGSILLNRVYLLALKILVIEHGPLQNLKIVAFNDYQDHQAVEILTEIFAESAVHAMSKSVLFQGNGGSYSPPTAYCNTALVIHSNGDGFGQNIETEGQESSLDGCVGVNTSAAASLKRDRGDLLQHLMRW